MNSQSISFVIAGLVHQRTDSPKLRATILNVLSMLNRLRYPESIARQCVWQLLKIGDPRIGTLRKFTDAASIPIEELVAGKRKGKKQ